MLPFSSAVLRGSLLLGVLGAAACAQDVDVDLADTGAGAPLELSRNARATGPLYGVRLPEDGMPKWWLGTDERGYLTYRPLKSNGDRLPDFSQVGYRGGTVDPPRLPALITLEPGGDGKNDTHAIQRAIAEMAKIPLDAEGRRGAILLKRGNYHLGQTVRLNVSGVVLRGEGQGEDGTVLTTYVRPNGKGVNAIVVGVDGSPQVAKEQYPIVDDYVPIGANSFRIGQNSGIVAGDNIVVVMSANRAFISAIGMDKIPPRKNGGKVSQWKPTSRFMVFQRQVREIGSDGLLKLDVPLPQSLAAKYGGGYVSKYTFAERISEVGVENMRGVSDFNPGPKDKEGRYIDEKHAANFIGMMGVENGWVRDVTSQYFTSGLVNIGRTGKRITVADCTSKLPVSQVTGGRRYSFNLNGELILMRDNRSEFGRHDFVLGSRVPGPNVFLNCVAVNSKSESGPHHRWSAGLLMDNVKTDHTMGAYNAGNRGSGHGWTGAQMVFWNTTAAKFQCDSPAGGRNWTMGGNFATKSISCSTWRVGNPSFPRSLYEAQLADRKAREGLN